MRDPRLTPAFLAVTADLSHEDRHQFEAFVERLDADAMDDPEKLQALRETWVVSDRPDLPSHP